MSGRKWGTLVAVCAATFMLLVDITIVNVALPSIQRSLDASFTDVQWVVDAYALTLAAAMLTAGSIADLLGRKRLFAIGVAVFTVASLLCALAGSPLFLNLSRALQGIGGSIMFATSLALIAQAFHGRERGTAFGIWGGTIGAAVAIGPLLGGLLTESLNWRWIFLINVPIGIATLALTFRLVSESRDPEARHVDWAGLSTFSASLFLLVLALLRGNEEGWSSTKIVTFLGLSAVLLAAFLIVEARQTRPMLDLSLFAKPAFVGAQLAAFTIAAGFFAMFLFLSFYLQNTLGYSPLQAGLRFLPITLFVFLVAPLAGRLSETLPPRLLLAIGLALIGGGLLLAAGLEDNSNWTSLLAGFVLTGIGAGIVNPTLATAAIGVVTPQRSGMASGINSTFRFLGISTGIAGLGAILQHHVKSATDTLLDGSRAAGAVTQLIASGNAKGAAAAAPPHAREALAATAKHTFISGLNELLVVGAVIAFAGAVLALVLVRGRDFVRAPAAAASPASPTPG